MLKKIKFKNEFTGIIDLVKLVHRCISWSGKEKKLFLAWLVTINLAALICNMSAALVFYRGLGYYLEPTKIPLFFRSYYDVVNEGIVLVLFITPFLFLSMIGSMLLRYSRVRLSRLVLDLRTSYSQKIKESFDVLSFQFSDEPIKMLDGAFGAMRALFLNGFVFAQFFVIFIFMNIVNFQASLVTVLFISVFVLHLSMLSDVGQKKNTSESLRNDLSDHEYEDEGLGISSSKSFERLERMRHLGRMYQNTYLIVVMLVLVAVTDDLESNVQKLLTFFILVRYVSQVFVPISVISGALVAPRKKIILFNNFSKFILSLGNTKSDESDTVMLLHAQSSGFKNRDIVDIENILLSKRRQIESLHVITERFPDTHKITRDQIHEYKRRIHKAKGNKINGYTILFTS